MIFEWCTDGFEGVAEAEALGVNRIELCAALEIGGVTPAESLVNAVRAEFRGEVFVMIRPRGGDFSYAVREIQLMKEDIRMCAKHGVDGVVLGLLTREKVLDVRATAALTELSHSLGLKVTFHRAIDFTSDPITAFRDVLELGVDYVLSSGGKNTALEGIDVLAEMASMQTKNCKLIAGAGVNPSQVNAFRSIGVGVHCTARIASTEVGKNMGGNFNLDRRKIEGMIKATKDV